jgi:mannose-6-phosphate isomerase-like protein (cupin superfamily)
VNYERSLLISSRFFVGDFDVPIGNSVSISGLLKRRPPSFLMVLSVNFSGIRVVRVPKKVRDNFLDHSFSIKSSLNYETGDKISSPFFTKTNYGEDFMIKAGFTFEHPITKTQTTVIESDAETNGMGWLVEITTRSKLPEIAEHLHKNWTETFEIISGTAKYSLDGVEGTIKAGESFVVNPSHLHVHPWSADGEPMVYRQKNRFAKADPSAVQDVLGVFATNAGLIRDRKKRPMTKFARTMQQSATVRAVVKHGNYTAEPSIFIQNVIAATLGLLAVLLGYKAVYPEYVGE